MSHSLFASIVAGLVHGKSVAAFLLVRAFRHSVNTALVVSASLAQIGEFSFILATLGVSLHLLPVEARDLILAGAIVSIMLNPLAFAMVKRLRPWLERREAGPPEADKPAVSHSGTQPLTPTSLTGHVVLIGFGRVGSLLGEALRNEHTPFLVIEESREIGEWLRAQGIDVLQGPDSPVALLEAANIAEASHLFVAIPNALEAGHYIEQAIRRNPSLKIIARAHSDHEVGFLQSKGAATIVMGEREIARAMMLYLPHGRRETQATRRDPEAAPPLKPTSES